MEIFRETGGLTLISEMAKVPLQLKRETQNGRYTEDLMKRRSVRKRAKTDSYAIAIETRTPVQYSVLRLDEETEKIQAGYRTAKYCSYCISERNMSKMKGISPRAPIDRRLNNKKLPIEKTGKIRQIWIFSAPRERN